MRGRYDDGGPPDEPEHPCIAIEQKISDECSERRENEWTSSESHSIGYWLRSIEDEFGAALLNRDSFRKAMFKIAVLAHGALEADALGYFGYFDPPAKEEPH